MAIQEREYYKIVSVHSLLQYIVSVTLYGHDDCVKTFIEMQQTASVRLNSIPYDITVIYVTYFQIYTEGLYNAKMLIYCQKIIFLLYEK